MKNEIKSENKRQKNPNLSVYISLLVSCTQGLAEGNCRGMNNTDPTVSTSLVLTPARPHHPDQPK